MKKNFYLLVAFQFSRWAVMIKHNVLQDPESHTRGPGLVKLLARWLLGFSCPGFSYLLFPWQTVHCKILQHDQDELFQDLLAGSAIFVDRCKGTSSSHMVGGCCWHLMAHHITRAQQWRQGCHTERWDAWDFLWSHSLFFNTVLAQLASACVKRLNQAVTLSFERMSWVSIK